MNAVWFAMWLLAAPSVGRAEARAAGSPQPATSAPVDLVWMAGPPSDAEPRMARPPSTAKLRALGARVYADRCAACHGVAGDGRGPQAASLLVAARDFTKGVYKVRSTPSGSLPTPVDLFRTVSRGMHGTPMFPWARLDELSRWALVDRLERFSPRFRDERPGPVVDVPPPPPETDALRARGHALYELHRCGACHGAEGAGQGPSAPLYAHEPKERAVRIRDFTRGRFIRGGELADVYLTLRTGMDGTPMGSYDALSIDDAWALAAYVRTLVREHVIPPPGVLPIP